MGCQRTYARCAQHTVFGAWRAVRVNPGTAFRVFRGLQVTHLRFFFLLLCIHGYFSFLFGWKLVSCSLEIVFDCLRQSGTNFVFTPSKRKTPAELRKKCEALKKASRTDFRVRPRDESPTVSAADGETLSACQGAAWSVMIGFWHERGAG